MPRTLLERLTDSLRACMTLLEQAQPELQGPHWLPPIELVQADEVLDQLASTHPAIPPLLISGHVVSMLMRIELFGDEFERLARSPDQVRLAEEFRRFVDELSGAFNFTGKEEPQTGTER